MKHPAHSLTVLLSAAVGWLLVGGTAPASAQVTEATLEIDFANYLGTQKSLSGIIHGAMPMPEIPELSEPAYHEFIDPLDFRIWETGHNMTLDGYLDMVQENHPEARAFLRVGGGLVKICDYEGDSKRPYLDFEDYRQYVVCVTEWARNNGVDVLDVWNEPNISNHFKGNGQTNQRTLFFETFRVAHEAIRETWPNAVIAAPSLGKINQEEWLLDFMEFCEENELDVDILTWHENGTIWNTDWLVDLPAKLQDARADYIDSGNYPNVGATEIIINEAVSEAYNDIPANNLAVLYYLEQGRADAAARTCWPNDDPTQACFNNTLNGLVTPPELGPQEKRAMWWLHYGYNQTLENRVEVTSDLENVIGIANDQIAMIGLYAERDHPQNYPDATVLDLTIRLKNVDRLPQVTAGMDELDMALFDLPYDEEVTPRPELPLELEGPVAIETVDGVRQIEFTLPMDVHHVFVLEY